VDGLEMLGQVALLSEPLLTKCALEILRSLVDADVINHIASLPEALSAAEKRAFEFLISPIRVAVPLQELLIAAVMF
jgi:hypothetical protein